jgi:hypothetical protein
MTLMRFLCSFFPGRCEPPKPEQTAAPTTSADLGQREAKNETLSDQQLRHMEGGPATESAQRKKRKGSVDSRACLICGESNPYPLGNPRKGFSGIVISGS